MTDTTPYDRVQPQTRIKFIAHVPSSSKSPSVASPGDLGSVVRHLQGDWYTCTLKDPNAFQIVTMRDGFRPVEARDYEDDEAAMHGKLIDTFAAKRDEFIVLPDV